MDALYPRLLVEDFGAMFRFYRAVLPEVLGAQLVKGTEEGPYANWDLDGEAVLVLFDRAAMAAVAGTSGLPAQAPAAQDRVMFAGRVDDVDEAYDVCLRHGATPVAPPADRPEWGPTLRTAHVRDPEGNLLELQSYEG
ncbi:extradiol dioxygenase [Actinomadura sp. NBRC 104425]|uniref:VOC family protein n=1 Tax=Actinomadura sp. NBRC 104425 TaxID=3032204 RepID=UPI0024A276C2|nr:VOC family protein [Actinomadura sp. NBRC 104425]GLZ10131.1 extradiol dioxygenase [Actinomadura sp. NBRC 104425]